MEPPSLMEATDLLSADPTSLEDDDTSVDEVSDWKEETGRSLGYVMESGSTAAQAIDPVLPG